MQTGDVIAFSGKGAFSDLIKWRSGSQISHVGKVLLAPGPVDPLVDRVMICESTTTVNLPDAMHGELIKGVQLHYLSQRLDSYDGKAWWFPLQKPVTIEQTQIMAAWLTAQHAKRVPYDTVQALGAGVDFWDRFGFSNDNDFSKLFCSEMCAKADVEAGLLGNDFPCSEVMPSEYLDTPSLFSPGVKIL